MKIKELSKKELNRNLEGFVNLADFSTDFPPRTSARAPYSENTTIMLMRADSPRIRMVLAESDKLQDAVYLTDLGYVYHGAFVPLVSVEEILTLLGEVECSKHGDGQNWVEWFYPWLKLKSLKREAYIDTY